MNRLNAIRCEIQANILNDLYKSARAGHKSIICQAATGLGKTHIKANIAKNSVARGKRVLVVTPRRRLTQQIFGRLYDFGLDPSYQMAGFPGNRSSMVQVACEMTLKKRIMRMEKAKKSNDLNEFLKGAEPQDILPGADTILIDECHMGSIHWLKKYYPHATYIGFSATPIKGDGDGLGDQYEDIVLGPSIPTLVGYGMLLPVDIYNTEGFITPDGDEDEEVKLFGNVVETWMKVASDRITVFYAKSRKHSIYMRDKFMEAGVTAEHIDCWVSDIPDTSGMSERDRIYARVASGQTRVLCNYKIVTTGVDIPQISCIILGRAVKKMVINLITYLQAVGRGRRPYDVHENMILIDHTKTVEELGHPDLDREWPLHTTPKETKKMIRKQVKEVKERKDKLIKCECGAEYDPAPVCPQCGKETPKSKEYVEEIQVELSKSDGKRTTPKTKKINWDKQRTIRLYQEMKGYYERPGKNVWSGYHKTNERIPEALRLSFHEYAKLRSVNPSVETMEFIKKSNARYFITKYKKNVA
jgi:superfamily II DNA or RNA helicase